MTVFFTQFVRNTRGVALLEFAFVLPFLLVIFLGGAELARYIVISQKLEQAAYVITNMTAQYPRATTSAPKAGELHEYELTDNVFSNVPRIIDPYTGGAANPRVVGILTSIRREGAQTRVKWQLGGGGSLGGVLSEVNGFGPFRPPNPAAKNSPVTFGGEKAGLIAGMYDGENIIIGEIFYNYQPFLAGVLTGLGLNIPAAQLYRSVFVSPRGEPLICLPPAFTYSECP
ncbi:MAG: hypothetical protein DI582_03030 [Azospirillum brasilense]|nr:MAG: hypothetical protein DI582_03030 [Azospirillum brasilense]